MAKRQILVGSTDQTIDVFIPDTSSLTAQGLAGLVYNSASLACYYRKGATGSATQLTLATQTVGGAHSDGGFVEIQATNMKGWYRLDLSDTMVAAAGMLSIHLYGATNMAPVPIEIEVVNFSLIGQSATDLKDFADDGYDPSTNKVQGVVTTDTATAVTTVNGLAAGVITAAAIATDAIDDDAISANAVTAIQSGLSTVTTAQVNAEVLDVLNVDTFAQPGQGTPAATTSIRLMIAYLYKAWRNRSTQTSTAYKLYNDDATTVDQKTTDSDDGTTFDKGEVATGP